MVGKGDNEITVVAACWNIVARLTVLGECFGSFTAMFSLGHILENVGMGRVFFWLLSRC